ncbi:MAG TPA: glycosyltransferase family 39 protein [Pyrinomonadaceae bacterium]|jgi:hypothetical protein
MDESLTGVAANAGGERTLTETIRGAVAAARRALAAHRAESLAACLLLLMAVNLFSVIWRKTITNDEFVHIPAGYYHLVEGNFHLNNEHPPLVKMWAALPLLFVQPNEPPPPKLDDANFMGQTWARQEVFWPVNREYFQAVTFWPRVWMLPVALALGALIFVYTRKLFGSRAAVLSVALYSFEPNFLAHGRVVHTDVAAALVYLLFFYTLHAYTEAPTLRRAAWLGLVCGLALSTKFSMIVLLPLLVALSIVGVVLAARRGEPRLRPLLHAALALVIALLIVNAAYYFQSPALEESDVKWVATKSAPIFHQLIFAFDWLSRILPTYFLFGLYNVVVHNHYGHAASLFGMHSDLGWWYYFPVAFALKTTLPFLLLSIAALAWAVFRLVRRGERRMLALLLPLALYLLISLTSHINIGIRHFLPVFPFLFIMGGALLEHLLRRERMRRAGALLVAVTLGWIIFEAARAYPDYVPYMNQLASGRPHWQLLSDSNVEWGDDTNALAAYLRARGETRLRAALSGAWGTLRFFGVEYIDLLDTSGKPLPETRYVAIGAGFLNGSTIPGGFKGRETTEERVNFLARYRDRKPEAVFGNSIYLYREHE